MYSSIITNITRNLSDKLPGTPTQLIMAPRHAWQEVAKITNLNDLAPAAVMILLYPKNNEPHIALIKRSNHAPHGGEIAIPGGKKESTDLNLSDTAIREASEELGINKDKIEIIGKLTPTPVLVSHFFIHPFVGKLLEEPNFSPNQDEVVKILEIPLSYIQKAAVSHMTVELSINGEKQTMIAPYFEFENHKIWGVTAMILNEFLATTRANQKVQEAPAKNSFASKDLLYHLVQI